MEDSEAKCDKCEPEVREAAADVEPVPLEKILPIVVQGLQLELDHQYARNAELTGTLVGIGLVALYACYKYSRFLPR